MAFLLKNLLQYRNCIAVNVLDDDSVHEKLVSRQDSLKPEFFRQILDDAIYKNFRRNDDDRSTSGIKPSRDDPKLAKFDHMLKDKNVFNGNPENIQYLDSNGQKYLDLQSRSTYDAGNLKRNIKANDTLAAIIGSFGIIIAFIVNDVYINNGRESDHVVSVLNAAVTVSTAVLLYLIYRRYSYYHEASKFDAINPKKYFWQTKQIKWFILEVLINIIHLPPYANFKFKILVVDKEVYYSVLDFVSVFMTLRIYLTLRLFAQYTEWMQGSASHACMINECEADIEFALKAAFKERPYIFLCLSMAIMTLILGLCVRTFERPYYLDFVEEDDKLYKAVVYQDYESVWNVFWLVFVTMSTVGFGDYYPITHFGRIVVSVAAFYGIFNTSLVVYILAISSGLDDSETKAFDVIRRMKQKNDAMNKASHVITNFIRIGMLKKRYAKNKAKELENKLLEANRSIQVALLNFRIAQEARKQTSLSVQHQLKEIVESMKVDIKTIKADLVILEEIGEKLNSIEDYNLRIMRKLNQEYSMILYTDKMLNLLANKDYVFEKTFPVIETQNNLGNQEEAAKAPVKDELENQTSIAQLDKEETGNYYQETNLIKNVRKVKLQIKLDTETEQTYAASHQVPTQFEPSTPL